MNLSTIFHFFKPQDTDLADLGTWISTNAATTEAALKNGIALQTNTSTTTYVSNFPLSAYADGHSFVFIPLYTCTGAVTINFNGLGVKKIFLENGTTQITSGVNLQKGIQYLLTYVSSIDGGIGAFKSLRLSPEILTGQVMHYAASTPPTGWLECNGAAVSRTTYVDLFTIIGTVFGVGNGTTTFNVPDLRGEFIRGWDNGRGVDTGRTIGSSQDGTLFSTNSAGSIYVSGGDSHSIVDASRPSGSAGLDFSSTIMTHPRNVALMACIKY